MSSPSPLPAEPVTDGAAHDELEITPAEPRQLFAEQRHEETEVEIRSVFEAEDFGAEFTPELREQEQRIREQAAAR